MATADGDDDGSRPSYGDFSHRLRESDVSLTSIELSNESGNVDLAELASLLTDNDILSSVTLRNLPLAESESAVISALVTMPNLSTIRLVNVNLTAGGARKLTDCKSWSRLEELSLEGNSKLGPRGIKSLAEKLSKASKLKFLNLCHCRMGHFGAKALGESECLPPSLIELDLGQNTIGNDGCWKMAEVLDTLASLETLKLSKNLIGDDGASEIGKQLPFLKNLKYLDMSNNDLADVGAAIVSASIPNTSLKNLDLSGNRISDEGAVSLAQAVAQSRVLEGLNLGDNQISDRGTAALAEALSPSDDDESDRPPCSLTSLCLKNNRIGDGGAGAFVEHLDENKVLVTLDLSGNNISSARMQILEMLLKHRGKPSKPRPQATNLSGSPPGSPQLPRQPQILDEGTILSEARQLLRDAGDEAKQVSTTYFDICTKHFDLHHLLSHGSFGDLYEGQDDELGMTFAIRKVVIGEAGDMETVRQRVLRELAALRYSQHAQIATLRAYTRDNSGCFYMVYSLNDKTPLDRCITEDNKRAQLPWMTRLHTLLNVGSALEYLHNTRSCFHGDIKPSNVLVGSDNTALLVDGGVSRLIATDRERFLAHDVVFGSRGYRCPRYERGSHKYGPESDMFSFGILMVEVCTGRLQNQVNPKTKQAEDFYYDYVVLKNRILNKDLDPSAGSWHPNALVTLCKVALACLDSEPMRRPGAPTIVKFLGDLSN